MGCNGTGKAELPMEWPKKLQGNENISSPDGVILIKRDKTMYMIGRNQALSEAWEVHQRVVGELKDKLEDVTKLYHEASTEQIYGRGKIAELEEEEEE